METSVLCGVLRVVKPEPGVLRGVWPRLFNASAGGPLESWLLLILAASSSSSSPPHRSSSSRLLFLPVSPSPLLFLPVSSVSPSPLLFLPVSSSSSLSPPHRSSSSSPCDLLLCVVCPGVRMLDGEVTDVVEAQSTSCQGLTMGIEMHMRT
jgi:hypothetical protein